MIVFIKIKFNDIMNNNILFNSLNINFNINYYYWNKFNANNINMKCFNNNQCFFCYCTQDVEYFSKFQELNNKFNKNLNNVINAKSFKLFIIRLSSLKSNNFMFLSLRN